MAEKKTTTRRQRSDEERIADLEAQLAAVRNKAETKDRKRHTELVDRRDKLTQRIDKLVEQRSELDVEIAGIQQRLDQSVSSATGV